MRIDRKERDQIRAKLAEGPFPHARALESVSKLLAECDRLEGALAELVDAVNTHLRRSRCSGDVMLKVLCASILEEFFTEQGGYDQSTS